jgi:uncharacterized protein
MNPLKSVCLILKYPRIGEVKTRLASVIGPERATLIYRALVEHQAAQLPFGWDVAIYFAPVNAEEEMKHWLRLHLPDGARFLPQIDGDLGQRLTAVMKGEFARGSTRIFLIGGDCPGLSLGYFQEADTALDSTDIVIGPADDGGYVLLGLNRPLSASNVLEALFKDIAWSSSAVLQHTLAAASNLSVHLLRPLTDIDDLASLTAQSASVQALLQKRLSLTAEKLRARGRRPCR